MIALAWLALFLGAAVLFLGLVPVAPSAMWARLLSVGAAALGALVILLAVIRLAD